MTRVRPILLAAGGTGGHLFPAEALARVLTQRGYRVELVSDLRAEQYAAQFPAAARHWISSGTVTGSGVFGKIKGVFRLGIGAFEALALLRRVRPAIVVGFGGYPTVPPLLVASLMRIPTLIHEQNAVMGRANRFLARRVSVIATGFPVVQDPTLPQEFHVGNPVRPAVLSAAEIAMPPGGEHPLCLCVFGGSQGARVMSEIVPPAIEMLSPALRQRLTITQQARQEDLGRVAAHYQGLGVAADVRPFFKDLPEKIAQSHLVIARGGASTIAELTVIGRPSIIVPLPGSLDQDQSANAEILRRAGAALVVKQDAFTPGFLAEELKHRLGSMETLPIEGAAARAIGIPDAAERLAKLVIETMKLNKAGVEA